MTFGRWKYRFTSGRFLTSVVTLLSATVASQLILVLATPLLTRLYDPDDFGVFAVFLAVMSVVLVGSSLRYEFAIPLPRNKKSARILLTLALLINILIAVLSLLAVAIFREDIAMFTKTPALADYLWLLPIIIFFAGSYKALNYWALRNYDYKSIGRTKILQSLSNIGIQLAAGLAGLGALGLILGQLVGQSAGAARLAKGAGLRYCFSWAAFSPHRSLVLLRKHQRFPKYDVPAATVDVMSTQLPNILLAVLFNPAIAGLYLLAERVLSMPMALIGQAVGQVLLGSTREAIQQGTLIKLAMKMILGLSAIIVLPTLVVFIAAEDLFAMIFGEVWREAGLYASWMMLGLAVQFLYSPLSMILMATNGQQLNLYINLFMLISKASAVVYGYYMGSHMVAIIGFSLAGVLGYGGAILVTMAHARKYCADADVSYSK